MFSWTRGTVVVLRLWQRWNTLLIYQKPCNFVLLSHYVQHWLLIFHHSDCVSGVLDVDTWMDWGNCSFAVSAPIKVLMWKWNKQIIFPLQSLLFCYLSFHVGVHSIWWFKTPFTCNTFRFPHFQFGLLCTDFFFQFKFFIPPPLPADVFVLTPFDLPSKQPDLLLF